ncbi:2-methylbutanal oxime monooxygenase [Fagus crenata]
MVGKLINSISQASPNPVDLSKKALSLTYSVICQIAFSQGYEELDESNFNGFMEEALEVFGMISTVDILPWLGVGGIVDRIMGVPRQIEKCYQKFDSFFERLLDDHLDPARQRPEHKDVVDVMLRISKDENAQFSPTKEHIKAVLLVLVVKNQIKPNQVDSTGRERTSRSTDTTNQDRPKQVVLTGSHPKLVGTGFYSLDFMGVWVKINAKILHTDTERY